MENTKNNLEPIESITLETVGVLEQVEPDTENLEQDIVEECLDAEFPIELFNKIMNVHKRF
jgi:hypothetical protein